MMTMMTTVRHLKNYNQLTRTRNTDQVGGIGRRRSVKGMNDKEEEGERLSQILSGGLYHWRGVGGGSAFFCSVSRSVNATLRHYDTTTYGIGKSHRHAIS